MIPYIYGIHHVNNTFDKKDTLFRGQSPREAICLGVTVRGRTGVGNVKLWRSNRRGGHMCEGIV